MACNPCCCSDCVDVPHQLVVTIAYPDGGGETVGQRTDFDAEGAPLVLSEAVSTTCRPRDEDVGVAFVRTVSPGSGYTQAPAISLSGGRTAAGPDAVLTASVISPITKIELTAGGGGYSTAPKVSFNAPAGGKIRDAKATAVIEGTVKSVTLTAGGEYSELPTVTIEGGSGAKVTPTLGDGFVSKVLLKDGGTGYTSPPSVAIEGNAEAQAFVFGGSVWAIFLTDKGSGYQFGQPPTVTFSGGGGNGAEAEAKMLYKVTSLTLGAGGTGYPESPTVTFSGAGSGATATATIEGSVVSVALTDAGSYIDTTKSGSGWRRGWPTAAFSPAGAKLDLSFEGGVTFGVDRGGLGYTSPPTISVSGDGDGAQGEAVLTWSASRVIVIDLEDCGATWAENTCTATTSSKYPPAPCFGCGSSIIGSEVEPPSEYRYGEELRLRVRASTSANETGPIDTPFPFTPGIPQDIRVALPFFFLEEAAYVYYDSSWGAGFYDSWDRDVGIYSRRKFSRIEPTGLMVASVIGVFPTQRSEALTTSLLHFGMTTPSTSPPLAVPTFSRHEDPKGDVFWVLTGLTVAFAGSNLFIEKSSDPIPSGWRVFSGNMTPFTVALGDISATVEAEVLEPLVSGVSVFGPAFSVQPEFSFQFTELDPGDYTLASVSVTAGGTTTAASGEYFANLLFLLGHTGFSFEYQRPQVKITVSDGQATGAVIVEPGLVRGPGRITSISLPPPNFYDIDVLPRIFTGKSKFKTTRSRSAPTVEASVAGGEGAELSVSLSPSVDQNGLDVWVIVGVTVENGGTGYQSGQVVEFTTDGVVGRPAEAYIMVIDGTTTIESVVFQNYGRFYEETVSETSEPLEMTCLGGLEEWEFKKYRLESTAPTPVPDVGDEFQANMQVNCWKQFGGSQFVDLDRTRRCSRPAVTFEFQ